MSKDLRTFLTDLADRQPGAIKRVDAEVDRRFGITAYGARADKEHQFPAFLFTDVAGSDLSCVTNLLATYDRMALALDCSIDALTRESGALNTRSAHPPVEVAADHAPVKEIIWHREDVDLGKLPIPVHNELDGGPFPHRRGFRHARPG